MTPTRRRRRRPWVVKASKQLTPNLKTAVSALRTADLSHRKIAEQLGYSNLAISKFLCRYDASGDLNRKSGSSGIKKSSEEDDTVLEQRFRTANELQKDWKDQNAR